MKTAASYIKKKYGCYKDYSEQLIRDVCHMWCEVIEEAQNDVKKEYEEKLRWIPVEEYLPKYEGEEFYILVIDKNKEPNLVLIEDYSDIDNIRGHFTHWRSFL